MVDRLPAPVARAVVHDSARLRAELHARQRPVVTTSGKSRLAAHTLSAGRQGEEPSVPAPLSDLYW